MPEGCNADAAVHTVTSGCMNADNAYLSNQVDVRI
jgi:hypothetical protein